ncbi:MULTISPECIES: antitoxin VbhA family protein [unclassified Acinetobacter]|uniref:antitoxin VbhA family protein n=1 Tax=unclassified Acinetobacter TaxID=196816 RepID=UPI0035B94760
MNAQLQTQAYPIDEKERQRRLLAWNDTKANFALEDIHPTEDMIRIGFMYINGEISFEQRAEMMKESILGKQHD